MHPAPSAAPPQAGWPRMIGAATTVREAARAGLQAAFAAARGAQHVKEGVADKAHAAADAAAAVAHAPMDIAVEVRKHMDEWARGMARVAAAGAAVGVLAIFALVIASVALVVLLNRWLGDPYGTLAVALLYVLAAAIAFAKMRSLNEARARPG